MTVYEIYKNVINNGDFVLSAMEEKIETVLRTGQDYGRGKNRTSHPRKQHGKSRKAD